MRYTTFAVAIAAFMTLFAVPIQGAAVIKREEAGLSIKREEAGYKPERFTSREEDGPKPEEGKPEKREEDGPKPEEGKPEKREEDGPKPEDYEAYVVRGRKYHPAPLPHHL